MLQKKKNRYIFSYERKKKAATVKRVVTVLIVIAAVVIALLFILHLLASRLKVELKDDRTVELYAPAKASDFITLGSGKLVQDPEIDTSTVGEKLCIVQIDVNGDIKDYSFKVKVVDTEAPVLELTETSARLLVGTNYDINEIATATDNSGEDIEIAIEGEYDPKAAGTQVIKYTAQDSSGNTTEKELTLEVVGITETLQDSTFLTNNHKTATIQDGVLYVDGTLIVNKAFGLPETYGDGVNGEAQQAFNKMAADALNDGLEIYVATGYRSYQEQNNIYTYRTEDQGEDPDSLNTAKPGHSEHQSGLALDLNYASQWFASSPEGQWILNNCVDYGFIVRYPEGKEDITGFSAEPWHMRYVGEDLAAELYNGGDWITLEEYFGIPSRYAEDGISEEDGEPEEAESAEGESEN